MEQVKVVYSSEQIAEAIKKIADKINLDYKDSTHPIVAVCLLKGAVLFYADLVRHLNIPVRFDFMSASSYGNGTVSSGKVNITKDLEYDIKDADVILIDDIVDSGLTMYTLIQKLKKREPHSIKVCCMLNKQSRRKVDLTPDYVGFEIPDLFVYGFGLDDGQMSRNLPYIAVKEIK